MDIANVVKYESTFEYELLDPVTGKETGLIFELLSSSSEAVKKVTRKHVDFISDLERKGKKVKTDIRESQIVERLSASIKGWRWTGDANWHGETPEFSIKNVEEVIAVDWIFDQLIKQVTDIENFTK